MGAGRGTPSLSPGAEPVSGAQDLQRRAALWEWEGQRWAGGCPRLGCPPLGPSAALSPSPLTPAGGQLLGSGNASERQQRRGHSAGHPRRPRTPRSVRLMDPARQRDAAQKGSLERPSHTSDSLRSPQAPSDVLSLPQTPSDALRRPQTPSDTFRCLQTHPRTWPGTPALTCSLSGPPHNRGRSAEGSRRVSGVAEVSRCR